VNVAALIVAGFMVSLNVAETTVFASTATVPFAGTVLTTLAAAAVVKVQTKLAASAVPAALLAPVVIVAVYRLLVERITLGVNVAVVPA
jgi:hypothetical protein